MPSKPPDSNAPSSLLSSTKVSPSKAKNKKSFKDSPFLKAFSLWPDYGYIIRWTLNAHDIGSRHCEGSISRSSTDNRSFSICWKYSVKNLSKKFLVVHHSVCTLNAHDIGSRHCAGSISRSSQIIGASQFVLKKLFKFPIKNQLNRIKKSIQSDIVKGLIEFLLNSLLDNWAKHLSWFFSWIIKYLF